MKIIKNIEAKHFYVFLRNCERDNENYLNWSNFKSKEKTSDWIFPLESIPKDFIEKRDSVFLKDSIFYKEVRSSFKTILKKIIFQNPESSFTIDRLVLYTNILNVTDHDIFGDSIELEHHFKIINKIIHQKLKNLNNYPSLINPYNYPFYQYEITHQTIQDYIEKEIKNERDKERIRYLIKNFKNEQDTINLIETIIGKSEKFNFDPTDLKKEKTHIEADIELKSDKEKRIELKYNTLRDELEFNDENVTRVQKVYNKNGLVGKIITLDNGDSYLVYKAKETGQLKVTDAYGISNDWLPSDSGRKPSKDIYNKVKDLIQILFIAVCFAIFFIYISKIASINYRSDTIIPRMYDYQIFKNDYIIQIEKYIKQNPAHFKIAGLAITYSILTTVSFPLVNLVFPILFTWIGFGD